MLKRGWRAAPGAADTCRRHSQRSPESRWARTQHAQRVSPKRRAEHCYLNAAASATNSAAGQTPACPTLGIYPDAPRLRVPGRAQGSARPHCLPAGRGGAGERRGGSAPAGGGGAERGQRSGGGPASARRSPSPCRRRRGRSRPRPQGLPPGERGGARRPRLATAARPERAGPGSAPRPPSPGTRSAAARKYPRSGAALPQPRGGRRRPCGLAALCSRAAAAAAPRGAPCSRPSRGRRRRCRGRAELQSSPGCELAPRPARCPAAGASGRSRTGGTAGRCGPGSPRNRFGHCSCRRYKRGGGGASRGAPEWPRPAELLPLCGREGGGPSRRAPPRVSRQARHGRRGVRARGASRRQAAAGAGSTALGAARLLAGIFAVRGRRSVRRRAGDESRPCHCRGVGRSWVSGSAAWSGS